MVFANTCVFQDFVSSPFSQRTWIISCYLVPNMVSYIKVVCPQALQHNISVLKSSVFMTQTDNVCLVFALAINSTFWKWTNIRFPFLPFLSRPSSYRMVKIYALLLKLLFNTSKVVIYHQVNQASHWSASSYYYGQWNGLTRPLVCKFDLVEASWHWAERTSKYLRQFLLSHVCQWSHKKKHAGFNLSYVMDLLIGYKWILKGYSTIAVLDRRHCLLWGKLGHIFYTGTYTGTVGSVKKQAI